MLALLRNPAKTPSQRQQDSHFQGTQTTDTLHIHSRQPVSQGLAFIEQLQSEPRGSSNLALQPCVPRGWQGLEVSLLVLPAEPAAVPCTCACQHTTAACNGSEADLFCLHSCCVVVLFFFLDILPHWDGLPVLLGSQQSPQFSLPFEQIYFAASSKL